jgi:hypothetical protein
MDDFRVVLSGTEAIYVSKVFTIIYYAKISAILNPKRIPGSGFCQQSLPRVRIQDADLAPRRGDQKEYGKPLYNPLYISYFVLTYVYIYLYPKPPITIHPNRSPPNGTTS